MNQQTINQIRTYISDNELEKALNLLIGIEQSKGRERSNTLVLLKGKLDMLEEQEMAGLLDFDELARQKGKIAHSILRMTEGEESGHVSDAEMPTKHVEFRKTAPATNSPSIFKYLFFGLLGLGAMAAVFFMMRPSSETQPDQAEKETTEVPVPPAEENDPTETTEVPAEQPDKPSDEGKKTDFSPTLKIDPNIISEASKNSLKNLSENQIKEITKIKDVSKDIKVPILPIAQNKKVNLHNFPSLNRAFNFRDIRYTLTKVNAEQYQTNKIKLVLNMDLHCRNNGYCDLEEVFIVTDGKKSKPISRKINKSTLQTEEKLSDELTFIFDANASKHQFQLFKNDGDWTRTFKILK